MGSRATDSTPGREWPEPRPPVWRGLSALDAQIRLSRLRDGSHDAILLYHSVGGLAEVDYAWDILTSVFRHQLRVLSRRYEFVDLATLVTDPDPARKRVAITFDDGFSSVRDEALPILREFDAPATVFLNAGLLGADEAPRFRDRHGLPEAAGRVALEPADVEALAADPLIRLGNHTATHPALADLADAEAVRSEVRDGKHLLEERFGVTVDRFSYPYGAVDERARAVVEDLHDLALTSSPGLVADPADPHALPRLDACQPANVLCFEATDLGDDLRRIARSLWD